MKDYYLDIVKGNKTGLIPFLIRITLYITSLFYGAITHVRNYLYDIKLLKSYKPQDVLVVSIGNLVLGGTGKTPAVQLFADLLYPNKPFAILTRGYRSKAENSNTPVILKQQNSSEVGDEPLIHAHRYPQANIIVNKNRVKSSILAKELGAEVLILDDGMQYRKLTRDLEVIVINAKDPFGQGHLFPWGLLRESPKSLKRADLIIINHVDNNETYQKIKTQIAPYTTAPCIGTRLAVAGLFDMQGRKIDSLAKRKAGIFCAIGSPDSFYQTIKEEGVDIVHFTHLSDHDSIEEPDLLSFAESCRSKGAECLICSEKDIVKIKKDLSLPLPLYWIKVYMEVVQGHQEWTGFHKYLYAKKT